MLGKESLPEIIGKRLYELKVDPKELCLTISADISKEGLFGERWLLVNKERLFVLSTNGEKASLDYNLPLSNIKEIKAEPLVGNGVLEIRTKEEQAIELLHYSNALERKFTRVATKIQKIIKNEEDLREEEDEFEEDYCPNCGLILPKGTKVCPHCLKKGKTIKRLLTYMKPYRRGVFIVALLMFLTTALDLFPPYFTKILIDDVLTPRKNIRLLIILVLILLVTRLFSTLLAIIRGRILARVGMNLTFDVRSELYQCLQRQSLSFYDKRQTGALMSRVTRDTEQLLSFMVDGIPFFFVNGMILIGIGVVLFAINWRLASLVFIPAPLVILCTHFFWRRFRVALHKYWHRWAQIGATLGDVLSGIQVVKAFGQEKREIHKFNEKSSSLMQAGIEVEQLFSTVFPGLAFLTVLGTFIVWYVGGIDVIAGRITLGTLIAFLGYLGMFYGPLQALTRFSDWISRALTSSERIFEIIDAQPEVLDAPDAIPLPNIEGNFEFKNVSFSYDKNKPVLKRINLKIKSGEMIGLVGKSGAGKTTIINLVCRFYDLDEGSLIVDGVDIRKVKIKDLRQQIGIVLQEPFLFSGTIAQNIAYSKMNATPEEIIRAAKAANAHEFIMKSPDGYDTQVGERGKRLSAGERQRISIARAILHNPKILILDEATASVDTETERQIQEAIAHLIKGRTTFAIAHRLSTLKDADRLIVFEEGKIVEAGTHEELLRKKGNYFNLVQLQRKLSQLKAVG